MDISQKVGKDFQSAFGTAPKLFLSPGRVNIIGEHTDYNNGFVLPAAIDKAICVGISRREDRKVVMHSGAYGETVEASLDGLQKTGKGWPDYILGVVDQLQKRGYAIGGCNISMDGDVPIGSGLSSSAALECATVAALDDLFDLKIDRLQYALIAQKAEQEFAGVRVGVMDPFASVFGKKDHAIRLDCQSLEYEYVPLELGNYALLLLNTNVKHSLASSEYNTRRAQCEQGVAMIQQHEPDVKSLRDVTREMLDKYVAATDGEIYRRCSYVVEENARLLQGCEDLKRGDLPALGTKMFRTHDGLSKAYEVSCPELDFLVDAVRERPQVLGARMMGGGFGGCTINIIEKGAIDALVAELSISYRAAMGLELSHDIVPTGDGTRAVS